MTSSQQKQMIAAVVSLILFVLGVWQVSMNGVPTGMGDDDNKPGVIFTVPEGYDPFSRVVDGDTIEVAYSETDKYTVRMIGINTPESVDPRKPVECFGKEATVHLKELLNVGYVRLSTDPSQPSEDKYDRWLRYVYTEAGLDVGLQMIKDGYAHEYTYNTPYTKQKEYRAAEAAAKAAKIGLWSPDTCNGRP
jgi:micrococcal nuclease